MDIYLETLKTLVNVAEHGDENKEYPVDLTPREIRALKWAIEELEKIKTV